MEKVTENFIKTLHYNPESRRKKSPIMDTVAELEVDEILFIIREEYKEFGYKTKSPAQLIHSASYQNRSKHKSKILGRKYKTVSYLEGWSIKRVK